MKLSDIQVGQRYAAKVSGRLQTVRIVELKQVPPHGWSSRSAWRTLIIAVNEATGRQLTIRSSQRLRPLVTRGCEFCRHDFNRPAGEFTCPYCQQRWTSQEP